MRKTAPQVWRDNPWHLLGKNGTVVASSLVRVAAPEFSAFTPYSWVVAEVDGQRYELPGVPNQEFVPGEKIACVARRLAQPDIQGVISYGIKVEKDEN